MVVRKISGTVVEADISGQRVRFFVHNQQDWIQRHHFNGEFYETDDLALIAKHVTPDTFYVDERYAPRIVRGRSISEISVPLQKSGN